MARDRVGIGAERGLEQRLSRAMAELQALTPAPARGKRQIRDESGLVAAAEAILKARNVLGLLTYTFERQEKRQTHYVDRGRGHPNRPTRETVEMRYQITALNRQEDTIAALHKTMGWRAYVTNAPAEELTLEQALLVYRDEWLIERGFHRLKGAPLSLDPMFVKRDDQVIGLTNLLSMRVRLLTLIEGATSRDTADSLADPHSGTAGLTTHHLHGIGGKLSKVKTVSANGQLDGWSILYSFPCFARQ